MKNKKGTEVILFLYALGISVWLSIFLGKPLNPHHLIEWMFKQF
ncbi:hypothetical protein [Fictibacillus fluitans]|uniref:Uncharacterized protein n=1 Tax=Fictibacillus fluitans TaxID=3058422 RepID=A0ABT8HTF5_9BACL|nr:hypothetical protein [Fictibacillus sp. NE201]MDN4524052.1 hypothetical protein [Fictibacillus sp. NE201]